MLCLADDGSVESPIDWYSLITETRRSRRWPFRRLREFLKVNLAIRAWAIVMLRPAQDAVSAGGHNDYQRQTHGAQLPHAGMLNGVSLTLTRRCPKKRPPEGRFQQENWWRIRDSNP